MIKLNDEAFEAISDAIRAAKKYNLTISEMEILYIFHKMGEGTTALKAGELLGRQGGSISSSLRLLRRKGIIAMEKNGKIYDTKSARIIDEKLKVSEETPIKSAVS